MPSIQKMFCEEIRRLAKKEAKAATEPLRTQIANLRLQIHKQKGLIRDMSLTAKGDFAAEGPASESSEELSKQIRMNGARIKKIRHQFGITQFELARLLNISHSAVVKWECDKATPRNETKVKIVSISKMGKRKIQQCLDASKTNE